MTSSEEDYGGSGVTLNTNLQAALQLLRQPTSVQQQAVEVGEGEEEVEETEEEQVGEHASSSTHGYMFV